jgi:class 3 adenylate cyclase
MKRNISKKQLMLLIGFFYLIGISVFTGFNYVEHQKAFQADVDRQLGWAAAGGALLLPPSYHHDKMEKEKLVEENYLKYARLLSSFNDKMKTAYIYSFVKKDENIYYTSTSYKEDEWDNAYQKDFLELYPKATGMLKNSFESKKITYEVSSDKFGTFKSIFIPVTTEDGFVYIMGADIEISYIEESLQEAMIRDILSGLYFLLILLPIAFLYRKVEKGEKELLEETVITRTSELNKTNKFLSDLSNQLSRYLSPQIKDMLFEGKGHTEIKSSRKKLTVYFSDIKDFTSTTSHMEPEELTRILNTYFDAMNVIALKHGATIDKYIGDAILIFTGDPKSRGEKEDAVACVSMAIEMRDKIIELQKKWEKEGNSRGFKVRAGVNSGYVTVGNFGSEQKMDYTIVGSQVNIAARLEGICEPDAILISHETYSLVKDKIECIPEAEVLVKGIEWPIKTYKVVGFLNQDNYKVYDINEEGVSIFVNMTKIEDSCHDEMKMKIEEIESMMMNYKKEKSE